MTRRRSFGSIFWALVLVSVGGLLLARNLGFSVPIWQGLAVYWPVLIIGWGLLKVVDYYRLKDERGSVFSGGEVVLLVFVLIVGSTFTAAANIGSGFGLINIFGDGFDLFDLLGESYEFSQEIDEEVVTGRIFEIHNSYGAVEIEPGEQGRIVVSIQKRVRASSREAAEELESELVFSIDEQAGRYVVASNRSLMNDSLRRRFRTSLRIRVPADSSLEVTNSYGPVEIHDLTGEQVVVNRYGEVRLSQIDGDIRVEDRYGPVWADDVSGDVVVTNRYGPVTLNRIGGSANVENRYAAVEITDIEGQTVINNRYSTIEVRGAGGDVRVRGRNNRVELDEVQGAVDVDTSYRDVEARNLRGSVSIANRHGDVRLRFDRPPTNDIAVTGDYSDVEITLPSDSDFSLEVQTRSGDFDSDFGGFERDESGRNLRVTGQVGDSGPRITVNTARGEIRLVRRD